MKIPKEYVLILIISLYLVSYLLESIVDPISLRLAHPYAFFQDGAYIKYPFSSAIILIRSIAIFMTPVWLLSFIDQAYRFKSLTLLVTTILTQLYAIQTVSTYSTSIPLEWSISLCCGSLVLLMPTLYFFLRSFFVKKVALKSSEIGSLSDIQDDWSDED